MRCAMCPALCGGALRHIPTRVVWERAASRPNPRCVGARCVTAQPALCGGALRHVPTRVVWGRAASRPNPRCVGARCVTSQPILTTPSADPHLHLDMHVPIRVNRR
eukprot:350143-Chlamydomonas_euryale.AAC.5